MWQNLTHVNPFFVIMYCIHRAKIFVKRMRLLILLFVISINMHSKCLQNIQFHTFWLFFKCKSYDGNFISPTSSFSVDCLFVHHTVGHSVGWLVNSNYYVMKRLQFDMTKLTKITFDEALGQGQHIKCRFSNQTRLT